MKNISIPDALVPHILGLLKVYQAQCSEEVLNPTIGTPLNPEKGGKEETEQEEKDLPPTPPIEKEEIDKEERRGMGSARAPPYARQSR